MSKTVKARKVSAGYAEGEALVSPMPLGFNHGVDPKTGVIKENGQVLKGVSMKGKIFVFPNGRGSTGASYMIYQVMQEGGGPAAMIMQKADTIVLSGAIMSHLPAVDMLENDAYDTIETGDYLKVDATGGTVEIIKKADR